MNNVYLIRATAKETPEFEPLVLDLRNFYIAENVFAAIFRFLVECVFGNPGLAST
jgi:hypothetical protein